MERVYKGEKNSRCMDFNLSHYDKKRGIVLPSKLTKDLAYLCGVLAGDGSIGFREKKYEYSIKCVGNPKDEKSFYFNIIGPKFKNIFGFLPSIRYMDGGTTFGFRIFSKSLVNYFTKIIKLPLGRKYDSLKIPEIFLNDKELLISFIRGVFDTDGSICFKKGYHTHPHYPVICLSSRSNRFVKEIAKILKMLDFKFSKTYNYKVKDKRIKKGFTIINRIELSGRYNLKLWMERIGFSSPKHLNKIKNNEKWCLPQANSGGWI